MSWLDKYDPKNRGDIASLPGVRKDVRLSYNEFEKNRREGKARKKAEEEKIVADRKARIKASVEARKKPMSVDRFAEETQAIGDKFRLFPEDPSSFIDDYLNPGVALGSALSAITQVPKNIKDEDYSDAALNSIGLAMLHPAVNKVIGRGLTRVEKVVGKGLQALGSEIMGSGYDIYGNTIYPIIHRKQIKNLQNLHANRLAELKANPEAVRRLKAEGIDVDKIEMPKLTFKPGDDGSYHSTYRNEDLINIDLDQIKRLQKRHDLSPKTVYEHEFGHFIQGERDKQSEYYQRKLKQYYQDLEAYNAKTSEGILGKFFNSAPELPSYYSLPTDVDYELMSLYGVSGQPLPSKLKENLNELALNNAAYFRDRGTEPMAHLREMRQNMINKGYIKDPYDPISKETIEEFMKKNPKDRVSSFSPLNDEITSGLERIFKTLPAVVPAAGVAAVASKDEKRNGGWLNKYVPKAQNGIEGTMGGLTDKGFNYNGAWGGTMQMGGSLPGTVGFTYARTAGAAPSNGPYAKKTKASAQFGDSVKKYQKPTLKEISKIPGRKVKEDSNLENIFEIVDPTGISSWDDIKRSYDETGWSPQTALEVFGAIPLLGKVGKVGKIAKEAGKAFAITARQARNARVAGETLSAVGKYGPAAGRATDTYQAYDEFQNGGEMKYYQEGLDFKPKTISRDGVSVNNADAQPLKKLDQLLNFTNYNKPTTGGWLDKY